MYIYTYMSQPSDCISNCGSFGICPLGLFCTYVGGNRGHCCVRNTPPPPSPGPPPPSPRSPPLTNEIPKYCGMKCKSSTDCPDNCKQCLQGICNTSESVPCDDSVCPVGYKLIPGVLCPNILSCSKATCCQKITPPPPSPGPPPPSPGPPPPSPGPPPPSPGPPPPSPGPPPPSPGPPPPSPGPYYQCQHWLGQCTRSSTYTPYNSLNDCNLNCHKPSPPSPPSPGPPGPKPGPTPTPTPSFNVVNSAPNSMDKKYKSYNCHRDSTLDYSKLGGMYDQFTKRSSDDYQKQYAWPKDLIRPDKQRKPERLRVTHNCLTLPKNNCHEHYQLVKNEDNDQWEPKSCILTPERIQGSLSKPGTSYDNQGKSKPSCIVSTGKYREKIKMRDVNSETNVPKIQCKRYKQKRTSGDGSKHYEYCDQKGSCTWTSDPPGPLNINPFVTDPSPTPEPVPTPDPTPYIPPPPPKKTPSVTPTSSMSTSEIIGIIILVLIVLIIPFLIYWLNQKRPYQ
jgi:hypothetical protein